jgi:carbon monoxide dehydrogenase subunit G
MPSVSIRIQAPPEQLWAMIADVTRVGEWSPETVSAEWVDGAAGPAVGAKF